MSEKLRRRRSGFTLVEVMISLMIFLVASMGLLPLLLVSQQADRGNSLHDRARRLAEESLVELQGIDYAILPLADGDLVMVDEIEVLRQVEQDTPAFEQSRITVTAQWRQQGRDHSYLVQTIRSAP